MPTRTLTICLHSFAAGGAEKVCTTIANEMSKCGIAVHIVVLNGTGPLAERILPAVKVTDFSTRNPFNALIKTILFVRKQEPKCILCTHPHIAIALLALKYILRLPSRIHYRVSSTMSKSIPPQNQKYTLTSVLLKLCGKLLPLAIKRFDHIIAVSEGVSEDLTRHFRVPSNIITVIYNPVSLAEVAELSSQKLNDPWLENDTPTIVSAGRLVRAKGYHTLLRAFKILSDERPVRLVILGDGPQRASLEKTAAHAGITEHLSMPGFKANPYAYMKRADLFVLSSEWEGMPNILLEAMACGCRIVSTDCDSGPRELLRNGEYGILVPVSDAEALSRAMAQGLEGNISVAPPSWIDNFATERIVSQYIEALNLSTSKNGPQESDNNAT